MPNQFLLRSVDSFIRKLTRAVVYSDAGFRAEGFMCFHSLVRTHVDRRHEPTGLGGSDRQQSKVRRPEILPDLSEMRPESRVSGEIYDVVLRFNHVAAPEGLVAVPNSPCGEMNSGHAMDCKMRQRQ